MLKNVSKEEYDVILKLRKGENDLDLGSEKEGLEIMLMTIKKQIEEGNKQVEENNKKIEEQKAYYQNLQEGIEETEKILDNYKKQMSDIFGPSKEKYEVNWVEIPDNHSLYGATEKSLTLIINSMRKEYMKKMKVSQQEAIDIFNAYCPIQGLLTYFDNSFINQNETITDACNHNTRVRNIVNSLKIPQYSLVRSNEYTRVHSNEMPYEQFQVPKETTKFLELLEIQKTIAELQAKLIIEKEQNRLLREAMINGTPLNDVPKLSSDSQELVKNKEVANCLREANEQIKKTDKDDVKQDKVPNEEIK